VFTEPAPAPANARPTPALNEPAAVPATVTASISAADVASSKTPPDAATAEPSMNALVPSATVLAATEKPRTPATLTPPPPPMASPDESSAAWTRTAPPVLVTLPPVIRASVVSAMVLTEPAPTPVNDRLVPPPKLPATDPATVTASIVAPVVASRLTPAA